ncbi:hypothetical protein Tco_0212010 [Tanacetum coccineum]
MDKVVKEKEHDYDIPLNNNVMQPLTPQTVYITSSSDDYVALVTNPMSNKQLNKFEEEFSNITKGVEKEHDNPIIETYDCENFIRKLLHQVSQSSREMKSQQRLRHNTILVVNRLIPINRGLIQAIPNHFPTQPIGEGEQRLPPLRILPGVNGDLTDDLLFIDLENPLCPNESKLLANILQNHPLRFSIAASSSVPWIYLGQFWHTLKEDGSKYRLKFVLDRKELTLTLDDFRTIFHLP